MRIWQKRVMRFTPPLRFVLLLIALPLWLGGCATDVHQGTPVHTKHANRGYNKPYQIKGQWYHPQKHYEYAEVGTASYYGGGDVFHGRPTSTGERFDMHAVSAAHKTLPLPCVVRVTNMANGRAIKLKVNDRGPFVGDRVIDLSRKTARLLGFEGRGLQKVKVECLVEESMQLAHHYHPTKNPHGKKGLLNNHVHQTAVRKGVGQKNVAPKTGGQKPLTPRDRVPQQDPYGAPAISAPQKDTYFINVAQYPQSDQASNALKKLKSSMGVPMETRKVLKGKQTHYRLVAGPFTSSQQAKNLLNKVRLKGAREAYIVSR